MSALQLTSMKTLSYSLCLSGMVVLLCTLPASPQTSGIVVGTEIGFSLVALGLFSIVVMVAVEYSQQGISSMSIIKKAVVQLSPVVVLAALIGYTVSLISFYAPHISGQVNDVSTVTPDYFMALNWFFFLLVVELYVGYHALNTEMFKGTFELDYVSFFGLAFLLLLSGVAVLTMKSVLQFYSTDG